MEIARKLRSRVVAYERLDALAEIGIRAVDAPADDPHRLLGIADGLRQAADAFESEEIDRARRYLEAAAHTADDLAREAQANERRAHFGGIAEGIREALALAGG